jgi:hypothetical protein
MGFEFPNLQGLGFEGGRYEPPPTCNPLGLAPPLAGYLLSLFIVSLFLLMMGSSAFSTLRLGLCLDKGSQVSFPLAMFWSQKDAEWTPNVATAHMSSPLSLCPIQEVEVSCLCHMIQTPFGFS